MRVLNLYAGIGGNRALWPESVHPKIGLGIYSQCVQNLNN